MQRRPVADDLNDVGQAISWADGIVAAAGLSEDLRHDLHVCIEEALANLIMHGQATGAGGKEIVLTITADAEGASIAVTDHCAPFNLLAADEPEASAEPRIGGVGLKLIRGFADEIRYESTATQNTLTMVLRAKNAAGGPGANVLAQIKRIPAFHDMSDATLAGLMGAAPITRFNTGERLMAQGEPSGPATMLISGSVTIAHESQHGLAPLAQIAAPALLGEIGALAQLPRTASVMAASPVEVLNVDRGALLKAGHQAPDMLVSVIAQLGQQIRNVNAALGLYASGFAALERGDLDDALMRDLSTPSADLHNFAAAFDRLAQRIAAERRTRSDMASAALIQRQMLPQDVADIAPAEHWDVFGDMRPAKDVGGDLFDIVRLDERRLALCVGDVCGKGVPASLFMCVTVTMLRLAAQERQPLEDMMAKVNALLYAQNPSSMFATLFYAELDLETGQLDYVNCGHNPPFLIRPGAGTQLDASGGPLGFIPNRRWPVASLQLAAGDGLFLFTDGVTEAVDPSGADYGEARLADVLSASTGARNTVEAVIADVTRFANGADPFDDVTCLALFRK